MIRFLIYRPVSVIVIYLALALLSIWSMQRIPISLLPAIDIPQITILVEHADFSAREVENKVLKPLRQQLLQIDGVENIEGTAQHESGMIRLRFAYGRDIDYAFLEVNEKVDQSLNSLPEGLSRPRVVKASADELPAFYLSLHYKAGLEGGEAAFIQISEFADQVVRRRLEQQKSIALVDLSGGSSQQIRITPNEQLLINLGISQADIQVALEMADLSMGSIIVREREYQYLVRLGQNLATVKDVQETALRIDNRVFSLKDLAQVALFERPPNGLYFFNRHRAISLAIVKNSNARVEELEVELEDILLSFEKEYPAIAFEKSRDQLFLLKHSLSNLQQSLWLSGILAMFIVFLFYRQWRVPLIIALIIPISVLLSLLFFNAFGLSINIISLSGLILGLGLMIDNGIIVLDNISQLAKKGKSPAEACIAGTNEMIRPLLSSMLTTCSVFIPLIFLSGISGALFYAQAVAVSIGLVVSYLVAITLLPVLYFSLEKIGNTKQEGPSPKLFHFLKGAPFQLPTSNFQLQHKLYHRGYHFTFKYPAIILFIALLLMVVGYFSAKRLPIQQLPDIPQTAFEVYLDWNENIKPTIAQQRLQRLFTNLNEDSLIYNAHIGQQQYLFNYDPLQKASVVHLYVQCQNQAANEQTQASLKAAIKTSYPAATAQFLPERTVFEQLFPTQGAKVRAGLLLAENATEEESLGVFRQLSNTFQQSFPQGELPAPAIENLILLVPNMDQLLFYQLTRDQLFQELKRALSGRELMVLKHFNKAIPVVISGPSTDLEQLLQTFQIKTKEGNWIPVQQLLGLQRLKSFKQIYSSRNGEYLPVIAEGVSSVALVNFFKQYKQKYPDVKMDLTGNYFNNRDLFRELLMVLGVSMLLLYFIMAAQFESLLQPIIILLEIPVSLAGSLLFLYLGGATLNAMAFIGMVVTAGIIINDSIIKIDTINRLRQEGLPPLKAIHEGGKRRLNPIIMTSLTSILAVVPFLWGSDLGASLQRPLALALIGGMTIGTLVSLFLIPLIYFWFIRKQPN